MSSSAAEFQPTALAPFHPNPLAGYEDAPPLPTGVTADGKSLLNPPATTLSPAYTAFPAPLNAGRRGGFDIHIYFTPAQLPFARALHSRIRYEFPELRIYRIWEQPIGPHTRGMFEVNVFTPHQFGALLGWLAVHRGELSVLAHPNTGREKWDHETGGIWMGERVELKTEILRDVREEE